MKITTTVAGVTTEVELNDPVFSARNKDRTDRVMQYMRRGLVPRANMKWCVTEPTEVNRHVEYQMWRLRYTREGFLMWHKSDYRCPVCGGVTERSEVHEDGVLYDSENRCTKCPFWHLGFSYGYHEEQIGFVWFDWSQTDPDEANVPRHGEMDRATDEIRRALEHPEFRSLVANPDTPIGITGDWLGDNGFHLQAEAAHGYDPLYLLPRAMR